jgi:hypothetical protein
METLQGETATSEATTALSRLIGTPIRFVRLVALYFGIQIALRIITSPTADLDESEQLVFTQVFQLGYGPQPPLYTWLQMLFFQVFGVSIFSLALMKNLLLFGAYYFTYDSARRITGEHRAGVTAALLLFLFPHIVWESQRDLTHTVLAATMAIVTLNVLLALHERPRLWKYLLFGACLGLGTLSNYNYAFIGLGLVCAGAVCKAYRRTVLDARMLLALVLAAVVAAPHLAWVSSHRDLVLVSVNKFDTQPNITALRAAWMGLSSLVLAVIAVPAPALVVWMLVTWGKPGRTRQKTVGARNLILTAIGLTVLVIAVLALVFHATHFKERWFEPLMIATPVLFVAAFDAWSRPLPTLRLLRIVLVVGALICIAIPARIWLAEAMHRHELLNAPFEKLTRGIAARSSQAGFAAAENFWIAGNVRLHAAGLPVFCPGFIEPTLARSSTNCILVWDATQSTAIPQAIKTPFANFVDFSGPPMAIETTEAGLRQHRHQRMKLGVALFPGKIAAASSTGTNITSAPAAP